jgi:uncharacterized protein YhhL (DUF1145 family)
MGSASLKIVLKLCKGVTFQVWFVVIYSIPQPLYQHVSHWINTVHGIKYFFCNVQYSKTKYAINKITL